jgi:Winged helix DNA-binding domain
VAAAVLSDRALNRALLARQGLLARRPRAALATVEDLVGLQAQEPPNPYVALWSRLEGFDPVELSALLADRRAVRAQLMRATIHLVSANDYAALQPLTTRVLAQVFKNGFLRRLGGAAVDDVIAAGTALLAEGARTRAQLAAELAERWPDADPPALAQAVTFHVPLVQVPPRGLWGATGQATWALAEEWLGAPVGPAPDAAAMVRRYLAAFGPASVADVRTWSGVTGLREVVDRLRPTLRTFEDERGRKLLDVKDGLLPDPATPAPPRFLPEYDNVALSHADRARLLAGLGPDGFAPRGGGWLLVDGFHRAHWHVASGRDAATLTIDRFAPRDGDPAGTDEAIVAEGRALLGLLAPGAATHRVQFIPALTR